MATIYSSAWKPMTLGTTTRYEAIPIPMERAGIVYTAYSTVVIPVGTTTADVIKLIPYQTAVATATPQIQGIRQARIVLTSGGNVGGSLAVNFGFAATGSATAYGSALTTLQSATTLDVAIATVMAGSILLTSDDLQLVVSSGTSTTLQTVQVMVQAYMQAP